jgi:formate hydrogenlyase transcriptional activator
MASPAGAARAEFERLGSGRTHRINVRVVAATHRNLAEMVRRNEFRSDLYYRLNVFPVVLPPLRERQQDISQLVSHFVEVFSRKLGKRITCIPIETLSALIAYPWPGNVRGTSELDRTSRHPVEEWSTSEPASEIRQESGHEPSSGIR